MSAALRLVECRAVLGGERDPFRAVWDERATDKDRRMLLAMAGRSRFDQQVLAGKAWTDLKPEVRTDIKGGLGKFSSWAARLQA